MAGHLPITFFALPVLPHTPNQEPGPGQYNDDKSQSFDEDDEVRQLLATKLRLDHNEEKNCGE
ncbi:MAG: hypothetical protein WCF26_00730 [Candidatus Sulfotelmatobacter sp.]